MDESGYGAAEMHHKAIGICRPDGFGEGWAICSFFDVGHNPGDGFLAGRDTNQGDGWGWGEGDGRATEAGDDLGNGWGYGKSELYGPGDEFLEGWWKWPSPRPDGPMAFRGDQHVRLDR